jgi:pimeloyl-ACP methyl ester carboxylesterase
LRGHGDSPGPEDWVNKSPGDVLAAWDALTHRPEVDPKNSAIVGASIGANLALIVGANNPDVVAVVALSPGEDYQGLRPLGVLGNFALPPARPVLLVASAEDTYSYSGVQKMAAQFPTLETQYLANAGHGTAMLSNASFVEFLFNWLDRHVAVLKG